MLARRCSSTFVRKDELPRTPIELDIYGTNGSDDRTRTVDIPPTFGKRRSNINNSKELLKSLGAPFVDAKERPHYKDPDPNDRYMTPSARIGSEYFKTVKEIRQIEAEARAINEPAMSIGRELISQSVDKMTLRRALRQLFRRCITIKSIMRVVALGLQRQRSSEALASVAACIIRALYRSRTSSTDKEIFNTIYALILRFERAGLFVDHLLYNHCAKFATRSRDPVAVKKALWFYRSRGIPITPPVFRSIIAKCSIGRAGFGEIRNGRWKKQDLMPVLLGFPGTPSGNPAGTTPDHHLGSFLDRSMPQVTAAWLQILAACQAHDELEKEWQMWKDSALRKGNRKRSKALRKMIRRRRDEAFLLSMLVSGNTTGAWMVLTEAKLDFRSLGPAWRAKLLESSHDLSWRVRGLKNQADFKQALLDKLDHELGSIERKLGVSWIRDGRGGGWHVTNDDLDARFEALTHAPEEFSKVFGYITEESAESGKQIIPSEISWAGALMQGSSK